MVINVERLRETGNPFPANPLKYRLVQLKINLERVFSINEVIAILCTHAIEPDLEQYFDPNTGSLIIARVEQKADTMLGHLARVINMVQLPLDTLQLINRVIRKIEDDLAISTTAERGVLMADRSKKNIPARQLNAKDSRLFMALWNVDGPIFDPMNHPQTARPQTPLPDDDDQRPQTAPDDQRQQTAPDDDNQSFHTTNGSRPVTPDLSRPITPDNAQFQTPDLSRPPTPDNTQFQTAPPPPPPFSQPDLVNQRIDPLLLASLFGQSGSLQRGIVGGRRQLPQKRKARGKAGPRKGKLRVPVKRRRAKETIEETDSASSSYTEEDSSSESDEDSTDAEDAE